MNNKFINSRVGHSIYVWGAQGEINPSEEWVRKKAKTKKAAEDAIQMMRELHKEYPGEPVYAYDCSGFVVEWLRSMYGADTVPDKTADGIKDTFCLRLIPRCKPHTNAYLYGVHPGCLLFRYGESSTRATHVGIVVDDKKVVHAKGAAYGVVCEDIVSSEWDASAYLLSDFFTITQSIRVSYGDRGVAVKMLQMAINLAVEAGQLNSKHMLTVDGVYGRKTEAALNSCYEFIPGTADAHTWLMCGLTRGC